MDPNFINQMLDLGGTLVMLDMPPGTEFGIDLESWNVGNRFKGIKLIPPGLHFIHFSSVSRYGQKAPRTGFFHYFKEREVVVKKYCPLEENIFDEENVDKVDRIKQNLRELARDMGPFPFESWPKWISFTQHIDENNFERLQPLTKCICSAPELINKDQVRSQDVSDPSQSHSNANQVRSQDSTAPYPNSSEESTQSMEHDSSDLKPSSPILTQPDTVADQPSSQDSSAPHPNSSEESVEHGSSQGGKPDFCPKPTLPDMVILPGTEIRFSKFPDRPYKDGASPAEVSRGSMDSSYTMQFIFDQLDRPKSVLAELQFSFICFLVGQLWDAWEHWRRLLTALCKAEDTLLQYPSLYSKFISILHYQIQEVPEDLFADIVESDNFMAKSLSNLFANIHDNASALPVAFVSKSEKFKGHLRTKFKWGLAIEEDEEDQPLVIETWDGGKE